MPQTDASCRADIVNWKQEIVENESNYVLYPCNAFLAWNGVLSDSEHEPAENLWQGDAG